MNDRMTVGDNIAALTQKFQPSEVHLELFVYRILTECETYNHFPTFPLYLSSSKTFIVSFFFFFFFPDRYAKRPELSLVLKHPTLPQGPLRILCHLCAVPAFNYQNLIKPTRVILKQCQHESHVVIDKMRPMESVSKNGESVNTSLLLMCVHYK